MSSLRYATLRYAIARSDHPMARQARAVVRGARRVSVPAPRLLVRPLALTYTALRGVVWTLRRVLIAEPWLKAHCASVGRGLRGSHFLHYFSGAGDLVVGDGVHLDGKSDFHFSTLLPSRPRIEIGSGTYVNHGCVFSAASRITLGRDVLVSVGCHFLDSPGHPLDPAARRAKRPPTPDQVRPIHVGDNAWLGLGVVVLPGVTIGADSVIAAGSVVTRDIPPGVLAGGIPARVIRPLADGA